MYGIKSIHALTFYVSIDQEAVLVKGKEKQMSVKKREKKFKAIILRWILRIFQWMQNKNNLINYCNKSSSVLQYNKIMNSLQKIYKRRTLGGEATLCQQKWRPYKILILLYNKFYYTQLASNVRHHFRTTPMYFLFKHEMFFRVNI